MSKTAFWKWREMYVRGDLHSAQKHIRTALRQSEECREREILDFAVAEGSIISQKGNVDRFSATIECNDPRGCSVMLKVTYHPNFAVYQGKTDRTLPTFSVSPSFLAFVVPYGIETYHVVWETPLWSTILFWSCYAWMGLCLVVGMLPERRAKAEEAEDKQKTE
jgi:hypothetical protein